MTVKTDNSLGPTLLLIAFIVLKLTGVINWSWWWVLSPFWIPAVLAALTFGFFAILNRKRKSKA